MSAIAHAGRLVVDGWMAAARLPLTLVTRALPDRPQGSWARASAELAVDRAEATVREKVGELLRDEVLVADGHRRREAAQERQRAISLRSIAEDERRAADLQLVAEREAANRRRANAQQTAERQVASVKRATAEQEQQASEVAARQRRSVQAAKAEKVAGVDQRAKRQRLDVLEGRLDELDEEATALTAADEAIRLRKAATAAKVARKKTG